MKQLPKQYDHTEAEPRWQNAWEQSGVYAWDESQPRENTFVIDTPPPTVSGHLHMGHIFSYAQADFVARYQRMSGKTVFYPIGFDDNGLPTERLVEKEKGKKASAYPTREDFIKDCREVVNDAEEKYRALFRSTALSVDWSQEYQTVSASSRAISQASFLDLLAKGEAYRDFRPTYWDWVDQTAIAQAEIENKELPGTMNEILFALEDGTPLHIATTRPELLGACVAVMYHPENPNAEHYKGKHAITPVFGVKVPMIADELVEQGKGTGLVMCCTFGDDTDKEWQRKHKLNIRSLLQPNGRMAVYFSEEEGLEEVTFISFGGDSTGSKSNISKLLPTDCIDIKQTIIKYKQCYYEIDENGISHHVKLNKAKANIFLALQQHSKLISQQPIIHTVKCAERSGTPIEIIPTTQWFVRVTDKKDVLKAKGAQCEWHPEFMKIRLDQWIDGLKEDWCISRQRFFGVPFPIWYVFKAVSKKEQSYPDIPKQTTMSYSHGELCLPTHDLLPLDPLNHFPTFRFSHSDYIINGGNGYWNVVSKSDSNEEYMVLGDRNVMDTWATSSVSPQLSAQGITAENCKNPDRFNKLFPADLRPQAHEIIRTWAFYTIVKAHLHANTIPWKHLMISGWCLAADKTKMSKSKGNVITPVELIRDKGADVVRYWASTSRLGADTAFSEDLLKIGRKLVTKLWNATSFAAIHLSKISTAPTTAVGDLVDERITEMLDKWILSRLHITVAKATENFERFEYCDARVAIEEFFWRDFCDNYLELVKTRAYGEAGDATAQGSAHLTLHHCLNTLLRLFAPFLPHVTEELYSHLFAEDSVHARGMWPSASDFPNDARALEAGEACMAVLEAIRKAKSERGVSIKFPITELVVSAGSAAGGEWALLEPVTADLQGAGTVAALRWAEGAPVGAETADKRYAIAVTFGEQTDAA